ncbi:MAG: LytTR family transcriptional regulator [Alkaliphilus sp.]|nr:MAG: LytTR family transcriptional regulator [Alkaliphilus sp.]
MINILIVDDEKHIREELNYLLSKFNDVNLCAEAETAKEALEIVERMKIDVVFLDIQLRSSKGMLVAKKIADINSEILIVMATAHQEYAIQSYDLDVFDYILKPFSEERIQKTISRIREHKKENKTLKEIRGKICISCNDKIKLINTDDLCFIEYRDNQTIIFTHKEEYKTKTTLKDLETQLAAVNFIRVHRAFIVNIDYIDEIIPWFNYTYKLKIKGMGNKIPVSRNYMKEFKERVNMK